VNIVAVIEGKVGLIDVRHDRCDATINTEEAGGSIKSTTVYTGEHSLQSILELATIVKKEVQVEYEGDDQPFKLVRLRIFYK
jgi:hypothetical protein